MPEAMISVWLSYYRGMSEETARELIAELDSTTSLTRLAGCFSVSVRAVNASHRPHKL